MGFTDSIGGLVCFENGRRWPLHLLVDLSNGAFDPFCGDLGHSKYFFLRMRGVIFYSEVPWCSFSSG